MAGFGCPPRLLGLVQVALIWRKTRVDVLPVSHPERGVEQCVLSNDLKASTEKLNGPVNALLCEPEDLQLGSRR